MKLRYFLAAALVACATAAGAQAPAKPVAIDDGAFGLAKGSVFDTATPKAFSFEGAGAGKLIAPPPATPVMIPHPIDAYLPLTLDRNACLDCHVRPTDAGKKPAKGQPRALSATHYVQKDGKQVLSGAQYNCTSCHAPQAGVAPLVGNAASPTR